MNALAAGLALTMPTKPPKRTTRERLQKNVRNDIPDRGSGIAV
jgi:hypothetical protein